jgi:hypothetical protein
MARRAWLLPLATILALAGCAPAVPVARFADTSPAFDPVTFFTGRTISWGVIENRGGQPTDIVTTDCVGQADGPDGLRMVQHVTNADGTTTRIWHMRRVGNHRFEATANDMVGTATGEASGRMFHWRWTLATRPGESWRDVDFEQWMYLLDDGAMVNRSAVTKFGVLLAQVTEQFRHVP